MLDALTFATALGLIWAVAVCHYPKKIVSITVSFTLAVVIGALCAMGYFAIKFNS